MTLTDADLAHALRLNIPRFQAARRKGMIPAPALMINGEPRWTAAQLATMLGETPPASDQPAAEAKILEAIGGR